jgi:hypothetical protein
MRPIVRRLAPSGRAPCASPAVAGETTRVLLASLAIACAGAFLLSGTALATSTPTEVKASTSKGVEYLRSLQLPNGEIGGPDGETEVFGGDWSLTAFAAAGVAAANVKAGAAGVDARTWFRELIADPATWPEGSDPAVSEYERASLVIDAAGVDPARVSKQQNLIAEIVGDYQPSSPGYYGSPSLFNETVFALLALEGAKTTKGVPRVPQALIDKSVQVIRNNQHTNGGWSFSKVEGNEKGLKSASEPDITGAAMAALCGAGVANTDPSVVKGEEYLESILTPSTGAFSVSFGANTDSNAWAVQGLNACAINPQGPQFTTTAGKTPIDFLIAQQLASGAFTDAASESTANVNSSQDAVRALAGGGFDPQPPKAKKAKQWLAEANFDTSPGVDGLLALVIDNGSSAVQACEVKIAPEATKTKLEKVLEAAETASSPAGCVTSFVAVKGKGAITQVNGAPQPAEARWQISIDGGAEKTAKATSSIALGDTIYLHLA